MSDELTALFVRVPKDLAEELAAVAEQTGRTKQSVVTELLTSGTTSVENRSVARDLDDVLDMAGVCGLLSVGPEDVLKRLANGDFPGRRLGSDWRFSRSAVMTWLAGTDPVTDRPVGFSGPPP